MLLPAGDRVADRVPAQHRRKAPLRRIARLILCAGPVLAVHPARADETCRYSGTTSYSGHVSVETRATRANGETTIDVTARVDARMFGVIGWRYLYQEIGVWRDGQLQTIATNHRYSVLDSIRRQQWDVFHRTPEGLAAYRVQGKTLDDLREKYPGFAGFWDPSRFSAPWLAHYAQAPPERRADLDLKAAPLPAGLAPPLPLAFYWIRWAGAHPRTVPVFLPGFKRDSRIEVPAISSIEAGGVLHLHSAIRYPGLSETIPSSGDAWISPDHHLLRVTFDARTDNAGAQGDLRLDGCQGEPIPP